MKRLYIWPITRTTPFIADPEKDTMIWANDEFCYAYQKGSEYRRQEISPDELTTDDLLTASSTFLRALRELIEERRCKELIEERRC